MNNDIKPGWQTTEFWVTGLTVLGGMIGSFVSAEHSATVAHYAESGAAWLAPAGLVVSAVAAGLYALARALTKRPPPTP